MLLLLYEAVLLGHQFGSVRLLMPFLNSSEFTQVYASPAMNLSSSLPRKCLVYLSRFG